MILLDRNIKKMLVNVESLDGVPKPYISNGIESCVTNIGYDLRAAHFMKENKELLECSLSPGESIFVSSMEVIGFSNDMIGRVALKNSRIRMGLTMDAPVYQPGHITPIYFRLTNLSKDSIELKQGEKYVTLIFEQLDEEPDEPYSGTFQNEFSFKGLADYKSEYIDQIQSIEGQIHDIKSLEKNVYGNVITILTIFIAIFSILNVNIGLIQQSVSGWTFLSYNLIVLGAVGFLAALLKEFLPPSSEKKHGFWVIPIFCFIASAVIFLLV